MFLIHLPFSRDTYSDCSGSSSPDSEIEFKLPSISQDWPVNSTSSTVTLVFTAHTFLSCVLSTHTSHIKPSERTFLDSCQDIGYYASEHFVVVEVVMMFEVTDLWSVYRILVLCMWFLKIWHLLKWIKYKNQADVWKVFSSASLLQAVFFFFKLQPLICTGYTPNVFLTLGSAFVLLLLKYYQ